MTPLSLKFRVDEVPPEGRPFAGALSRALLDGCLPGLVGELGYEPTGEAAVTGHVYRSAGQELVVHGSLTATVGCACVRCLEAVELSLTVTVDHVYVRRAEAVPAPSEELVVEAGAEGEDDTLSYSGEEVDLTAALREELLLELPMNPTCALVGRACVALRQRPEPADTVDPRWAPLLALRKKMQDTAGPEEAPPEAH